MAGASSLGTLQTSGAISLNDIHVKSGGTSGTTSSLNTSAVRGLNSPGNINATLSTSIGFADFYGAFTGTHKITFVMSSSTLPSSAYYGASSITIHGGYQYSNLISSTPIIVSGGNSNITRLELKIESINVGTQVSDVYGNSDFTGAQYTLFSEMVNQQSLIKLTDNNNNVLWEADYTGQPISPTPSFANNASSGNRRPTGYYEFTEECDDDPLEMFWRAGPSISSNYHMFDLTGGASYKLFFEA